MLKHIIKNEWRNLVADHTFWTITLLFAVCLGYAMHNGFAWTGFQNRTIAETKLDEEKRYADLERQIAELDRSAPKELSRFSDPRDAAAAGRNVGQRFVQMPPHEFGAFSIGQSDLLPYYFKISTRSETTFINNDELENPTNLLAGRFDAAFVIIYLLPLLILGIGYNFISGEREAGTLQMLLAQPVRPLDFIIGKIALRFAVVVVSATILALVFFVLGGGNLAGDGAARFGLWTLAVLIYSFFWFALVVLINSFRWKSATNALALAGLWLFFVIVVPSLTGVFVMTAHPVPSRIEMINAAREASTEASAEGSRLMARYQEDHPELMQGNYDATDAAMRTYATQDAVDRRVKPILENYDRQLLSQQNMVRRLQILSPAIAMQEILNDISGTGNGRYQHFSRQVKEFHKGWQDYFVPRSFQKMRFDTEMYRNSPQFRWQEEDTNTVVQKVSSGLLGVLAFGAIFAAIGLTAAGRTALFD
jgi:ABC-2 type transport system permease protein